MNNNLNELEALVKAVLSGDTIVVVHPTKLPPVEKTITIAGISAPRFARKEKEEEPYAFASREFLRKKCIGKLVKISVLQTNIQTKRDYCIVKADNEDLGLLMIENGLAKLTSKKSKEEFQKAEDDAKNQKKRNLG
jgi:staphylococcal nuclease domain-containing protein 1